MRVCLLTPEYRPTWGGVGTYTFNLARGLRERAEVHIFTANDGRSGESPDGLEGVQIHAAFPKQPPSRSTSQLRFQMAALRRLPRLSREEGFDILHANHAYMSDILTRARRTRARSVLTVHTTLGTQMNGTRNAGTGVPRHPIERDLSRWGFMLRPIERAYLESTPSMIFVSQWVKRNLLQEYHVAPRRSTVVPNAVDIDAFTPGPLAASRKSNEVSEQGPTVLFVGRLLALKGLETLLRAHARINPSVRLLLAGAGEQEPWKALARGLGLSESRCQFLGSVPYASMPALYQRADVVVLPSFAESCPMVALEAMAAGRPLIAADAGGVSEIVQDGVTGRLFPPGDVDRLSELIQEVLDNPDPSRTVCEQARQWVQAHASIERMASQTFAFYEQVLNGDGA